MDLLPTEHNILLIECTKYEVQTMLLGDQVLTLYAKKMAIIILIHIVDNSEP